MNLWSRLLRWKRTPDAPADLPAPAKPAPESATPVELPIEPFVFECRECGKVFDARRTRPRCPECESADVSLLSE
jgi:rubrerythrin